MKVRCPHCNEPIESVEESSLRDVNCPSCGSVFSLVGVAETETRIPGPVKTVGRFELIARVGVGAFGTVWKARDPELDRTVAVKVPRKEQILPEEAEQFLREARAAAQLRHPGIVSVQPRQPANR